MFYMYLKDVNIKEIVEVLRGLEKGITRRNGMKLNEHH